MSTAHQARPYITKTERLLNWAHAWLGELREHGRHARVEEVARVMFAALHAVNAAHDALAVAANLAGRHEWRDQLHKTQAQDPLLRYLWLAQHAELPGKIVQWNPDRASAVPQVVDGGKLQHITSLFFSPLSPHGASERLLMFAHGASTRHELKQKQGADTLPDPARMEAAGLELVHGLQALALQAFDVPWGGRMEHVAVPDSHLGIKADYGVADQALDAGIVFYRSKSDELSVAIGP